MASFNPYHKWLGIPLGEQPANHYRLLENVASYLKRKRSMCSAEAVLGIRQDRQLDMKTKIIASLLIVVIALLAGCSKETEPAKPPAKFNVTDGSETMLWLDNRFDEVVWEKNPAVADQLEKTLNEDLKRLVGTTVVWEVSVKPKKSFFGYYYLYCFPKEAGGVTQRFDNNNNHLRIFEIFVGKKGLTEQYYRTLKEYDSIKVQMTISRMYFKNRIYPRPDSIHIEWKDLKVIAPTN